MYKRKSRRFVARSVLSLGNTELTACQEDYIDQISSPVKRLAAAALHHAAVQYPGLAARFVGLEQPANIDGLIGMGFDSVVMRSGQNVAKLHLLSLPLSRPKQERYARTKDIEYRALASQMRSFMLDQSVNVSPFPGSTSREVVQTTQPFRQLTPVQLFRPNTASVNPAEVRLLTDRHPSTKEQLAKFVGQSLKLFQSDGILPDVLGEGNLGLDPQGQLILIDGYPLPPDNKAAVRDTVSQLTYTGELLSHKI